MKRSLFIEDVSFDELPEQAVQRIVTYAYNKTPQISSVSKQWSSLLDSYDGWFALAQRNYSLGEWTSDSPVAVMQRTVINTLVAKKDKRAQRFCNYIGRHLCRKMPALTHLIEERVEVGPVVTPVSWSISEYVKAQADNILSLANFHPRDIYLNFTEVGHRYSLVLADPVTGRPKTFESVKLDDDDEHVPPSVVDEANLYAILSGTTFIHLLFPAFDEQAVITMMMASPKWEDPVANAYYGMTREEISTQWEEIRLLASKLGTAMHANLEMYNSERPYVSTSKEFRLFKGFEKEFVTGKLRPYRTEWTIFNAPVQLCGSVDILYEYINEVDHGDGKKHLVMADWKRAREIKQWNSYASGCVPATMHMPDCGYSCYSIQLSLYKYLLEKEYDVIIDSMHIVSLHPNEPRYLCLPVQWEYLKDTFKNIIDHRVSTLSPLIK